jgi:hypothetical protein
MPLQSQILSGNALLESVARGASLLYAGSPANDRAAVQVLQRALAMLGFPLPVSFRSGVPDGRFGQETANAVVAFQKKVFPNQPREWDGRVGKKTLGLLDTEILRGKQSPAPVPPPPAPVANFVCGPDITAEVRGVWTRIQSEFKARARRDKIKLCNRLLLPINDPGGLVLELLKGQFSDAESLEKAMARVRAHADINGWDVLPLFQGLSKWLRTPPVFDPARNGPFATPSSSEPANSNPFAPGHEDAATCSNTVQVAGKCWLGGSVNYGTFGIMVRQCSNFAATDIFVPPINIVTHDPFDLPLSLNPIVRLIYSLTWAKMLIKAYKQFGNNPEGATIPVAWTTATFDGGPNGTPGIPGNRPKCQCKPGLTGNIVRWDYVWEPLKPRAGSTLP